jgi:RNA polymerase sigma-70 factor (ECF subfamily)
VNDPTISAKFPLDEPTFEQVFKEHYGALYAYANVILKDSDGAEEVVQTVFLKLWERRSELRITTSLKAYLYKAVYHYSLNQIKHQKVRQRHWEETHYIMNQHLSPDNSQIIEGQENELVKRIQQTLDALPDKCRMVFHLSRFEELKYGEIAEQLGISVKTVEAHMSKALKTLRLELAEFLPLVILILQLIITPWNL